MIAPGDVLRNRYRIERSIGRGGMGEVFAAVVLVPAPGNDWDEEATLLRPSENSYRVAIKVVSRAVVNEAAMARLQREAVAASRIKSAFVPELIEVSTTPDGEVFLAMEILYGETLAARLKTQRCLRWEEAFLLGDDVLSGLIDAHEAGVVHRDLKPSNIFLCERTAEGAERAKVLDFGVCKLDTPDEEKLTVTGESVGTASYMAPEQIRGASHVTERADLYSFATVIFEAVSGQLPHLGAGQMAILASKLERSALRLDGVAQVPIPVGLDALLGLLLSRDPAKRLATARDVRRAWRALGPAVLEPRPAAAVPAAPESSPLATETGLATGSIVAPVARLSRAGFALAAFSVTVSIVVILVMLGARRDPAVSGAEYPSMAPVPVGSAGLTERPPAASSEPSDQDPEATGVDPSAWTLLDAAASVVPAPPPSVPRRPTSPRPGTWRPPPHPPTKPHIADKPRY